MCEIQFIKRFDNKKLSASDINNFMEFMLLGYSGNPDAYGIFSDRGILTKGNDKLSYDNMEVLKEQKHRFLVGHNRYKTTGDAKVMDNNHPFESEHFMLVHNGVISNHKELKARYSLDYSVETDSYIAIALLEHFLLEGQDVKKAMKSTFEKLDGSFSIMVYHKQEHKLYYTKSTSTSFSFALIETEGGDILVGSTDDRNFEITFESVIRGVFRKPSLDYLLWEPKSEIVYEITNSKIVKLFEYTGETYNYYNGYGYGKTCSSTPTKKSEIENSTAVSTHEDYTKKQIFKEVGKIIVDALPADVNVLTRSYYLDHRNQVILYVDCEISAQTMETLQDKVFEYGSVTYEEIVGSHRGKIVIEVDESDAKKYLQGESDFITPAQKTAEEILAEEWGRDSGYRNDFHGL